MRELNEAADAMNVCIDHHNAVRGTGARAIARVPRAGEQLARDLTRGARRGTPVEAAPGSARAARRGAPIETATPAPSRGLSALADARESLDRSDPNGPQRTLNLDLSDHEVPAAIDSRFGTGAAKRLNDRGLTTRTMRELLERQHDDECRCDGCQARPCSRNFGASCDCETCRASGRSSWTPRRNAQTV
jgi:hypothetical protein